MDPNYNYGIITVIIVFVLIISIWYFSNQAKNLAITLNKDDLDFTSRTYADSTTDDIVTDLLTPYFSPIGEHFGARQLNPNEAIVIYGEIPRNCYYWGITGYMYDGEKYTSLGDSISNATVKSLSVGDGVAVVMLTNPILFEEIKRELLKEWHPVNRRHPLNIIPVYIPDKLYISGAKYTMVLQLSTRKYVNDFKCELKCRHYSGTNVPKQPIPIKTVVDRDCAPKEQDSVSEVIWSRTSLKALDTKQYGYNREIPVYHRESLNNGYSHVLGNRDITMFETEEFDVNEDESIVVVAADHASSSRSTYSSVTFYDEGCGYGRHTTGDPSNRVRNLNSSVRAHMILNNPGVVDDITIDPEDFDSSNGRYVKTFGSGYRVIERIYSEPVSGIGPGESSVLPMKVFIVKKAYPTQQTRTQVQI